MRISDWSSDVCSSDLKKKELALPAQPKESWHGSPPSKKNAKEKLENAKSMAQDGKEDGCMRSEERRVGQSVSVRVDLGGRRIIKKKKQKQHEEATKNYKYIQQERNINLKAPRT